MTPLAKNIIIPLIAVQEWVAVISQPSSEDNISDAKFLDKSDYFSNQSSKK